MAISELLLYAKSLENIIFIQLLFLDENNIHQTFNSGDCAFLVLLDLSVDFNNVNHDLPIKTEHLEHFEGVKDLVLN